MEIITNIIPRAPIYNPALLYVLVIKASILKLPRLG